MQPLRSFIGVTAGLEARNYEKENTRRRGVAAHGDNEDVLGVFLYNRLNTQVVKESGIAVSDVDAAHIGEHLTKYRTAAALCLDGS